jgi:hypothetical protein
MKKCSGVFFLGAFLSGCASQSVQTELAAVDGAGSQSYYASGWIVQSQKDTEYLVELAVYEAKQPWEEVTAVLYLENRSDDPVTVSINDITLQQDERQVSLRSYAELEQRSIRHRKYQIRPAAESQFSGGVSPDNDGFSWPDFHGAVSIRDDGV